MGADYSVAHAACLVSQLPRSARTVSAINPDAEWSRAEMLLSNIEYWLHWLAWSRTEDGMNGANCPKPIFGGERAGSQGESMTIEELEEFLSRPRKEG